MKSGRNVGNNRATQQAPTFLQTPSLELFTSPQSEPFARITVDGHHEYWPLFSERFRRWLECMLFFLRGAFPPQSLVKEHLRQMEGMAMFLGPTRPVHLRVAGDADKLYIDLCDDQWQVVEVSVDGWLVLGESPVVFRRSPGMQALPAPIPGGSVQELLPFVNAGTRDQQLLLLAWIVMAFRPTGPYPVLSIQGAQGSAKSTCQKVIRSLIDPSDSPLRTTPKDERDLMISAKHAHLVAYDNLSSIPAWLSDSFCRLATGGGLATRQLYTDEKQMIFQASRPILINGIENLAERGDLLDRVVNLHLPPIPAGRRKNEADFWNEFEFAKPRIFGALLDVLSKVLRRVKAVHISNLPRMADFAIWATAAEEALGFDSGEFMAAYQRNRKENSLHAIECSPAASELIDFVKQCGLWEGTHAELLTQLNLRAAENRRDPQWPKSGRAMAAVVARAEPNFSVAGIEFTRLRRKGGTGARQIRLEIVTPSQPGAEPATSQDSDDVTVRRVPPRHALEMAVERTAPITKSQLGG
jgi:hypothetical protein